MIYCYIQNCHLYKYAKILRDWYNSLLKWLLILSYSYTKIIFEFVTDLLISKG